MLSKGMGCDDFINCFPDGKVNHLWRGFGKQNFHGTAKHGPVRNRRPRNTPEWIHLIADKWFFDNFGVNYRTEALFCTGDKTIACYYGNIYPVAPLDGYSFCWSPEIKDLFKSVSNMAIEDGDSTSVIELLERGNYRTEDLVNAIASGSEIMIKAEEYLILAD